MADPGFWNYYSTQVLENLGQITFTVEGNLTQIVVLAQLGSMPTLNSYAQAYVTNDDSKDEEKDDTETTSLTILSPRDPFNRKWYFGVINNSTLSTELNITFSYTICNSTNFGDNCQYGFFFYFF